MRFQQLGEAYQVWEAVTWHILAFCADRLSQSAMSPVLLLRIQTYYCIRQLRKWKQSLFECQMLLMVLLNCAGSEQP